MVSSSKAVFWDLGGTLAERKYEVDEDSIQQIYAVSSGEALPAQKSAKLIRNLQAAEIATWNACAPCRLLQIKTLEEEFLFLRDEFYPAVLARLKLDAQPQDVLAELARRQLGPKTFRLFPDVVETLDRLKSLGLQTGVVSNALPSAEGILEHLGLLDYFDNITLSCNAECHCLKPSKRIHQEALRHLGLAGKDVIFVDDRLGFVTAAQSIYGRSILIDREHHHAAEKVCSIEKLDDLFLLLDSEQFVAGPNRIPFSQLPLYGRAFFRKFKARVTFVGIQSLQNINWPHVRPTLARFLH